jgi:hypothetical protein
MSPTARFHVLLAIAPEVATALDYDVESALEEPNDY